MLITSGGAVLYLWRYICHIYKQASREKYNKATNNWISYRFGQKIHLKLSADFTATFAGFYEHPLR